MSGDKLLSRRQILALFGTGMGTAIVASTQAASNQSDATIYGGTSGMATLYKVGEGMWKGPLSVRSQVPQEDGNTFIQTDAGSNGNKFKFFHYNSGWSAQGWGVPSLTADEAVIKTARGANDGFSAVDHFDDAIPTGARPHPAVDNPIVAASDVTDVSASFVADPLWYKTDVFFEIGDSGYGTIGRTRSSDGLNFTYDQEILDPGYHLSMPQTFDWNGEVYLHPSSADSSDGDPDFILFKFTDYEAGTTELVEKKTLPKPISENVIFPYDGRWWLCSEDPNSSACLLFYSDTYPQIAGGSWTEHPSSPLPRDPFLKGAVSGPPILSNGNVYLCGRVSGRDGYVEITELTTNAISGRKLNPVLPEVITDGLEVSDPHALDSQRIGSTTHIVGDGLDSGGNYQICVYESVADPSYWAELGLSSNQTITTQSTDGWQTINTNTVNSAMTADDVFPGIPLINVNAQLQQTSIKPYGGVKISGVSGVPFDLQVRIWDNANNTALAEQTFRITETVDQTVALTSGRVDLTGTTKTDLQVQQNSGSDLTAVGEPSKTFYAIER